MPTVYDNSYHEAMLKQAARGGQMHLAQLLHKLGDLTEQAGCDCCHSVMNERCSSACTPGELKSCEDIPAVDYDDGPLGMYAPSMPRATADRATSSARSLQSGGGTYTVLLNRMDGEKLGLDVDFKQDRVTLPIIGVKGGVAERWNILNPDLPLAEGDSIIEVNGTRRDVSAMVELCQTCKELRIVLVRGPNNTQMGDRSEEDRRGDCLGCSAFRKDSPEAGSASVWTWLLSGGGCRA